MMVRSISASKCSIHHRDRGIRDKGIETFSFEAIKTVEYIDDQKLLIAEIYMDKYDSFNKKKWKAKYSEDMFNLFSTFHFFSY